MKFSLIGNRTDIGTITERIKLSFEATNIFIFTEGRQVKAFHLMFDFTIEALQGNTGVLLNEMCPIDCIEPFDFSILDDPSYKGKRMREALASLILLPLFMIRFTALYLNEVMSWNDSI